MWTVFYQNIWSCIIIASSSRSKSDTSCKIWNIVLWIQISRYECLHSKSLRYEISSYSSIGEPSSSFPASKVTAVGLEIAPGNCRNEVVVSGVHWRIPEDDDGRNFRTSRRRKLKQKQDDDEAQDLHAWHYLAWPFHGVQVARFALSEPKEKELWNNKYWSRKWNINEALIFLRYRWRSCWVQLLQWHEHSTYRLVGLFKLCLWHRNEGLVFYGGREIENLVIKGTTRKVESVTWF